MRCFENWGCDGAALELHCSLADVVVAVQALGRRCSLVVVAAPVVVGAHAPRRWPLEVVYAAAHHAQKALSSLPDLRSCCQPLLCNSCCNCVGIASLQLLYCSHHRVHDVPMSCDSIKIPIIVLNT